jgi:hypothetical protein
MSSCAARRYEVKALRGGSFEVRGPGGAAKAVKFANDNDLRKATYALFMDGVAIA